MQETWKPIPGYEGLYEVSDCGNVRGVDRYVANFGGHPDRLWRGKILWQRVDKINRRSVDLCLTTSVKLSTFTTLCCLPLLAQDQKVLTVVTMTATQATTTFAT